MDQLAIYKEMHIIISKALLEEQHLTVTIWWLEAYLIQRNDELEICGRHFIDCRDPPSGCLQWREWIEGVMLLMTLHRAVMNSFVAWTF